jgi:hypothetical protein
MRTVFPTKREALNKDIFREKMRWVEARGLGDVRSTDIEPKGRDVVELMLSDSNNILRMEFEDGSRRGFNLSDFDIVVGLRIIAIDQLIAALARVHHWNSRGRGCNNQ